MRSLERSLQSVILLTNIVLETNIIMWGLEIELLFVELDGIDSVPFLV